MFRLNGNDNYNKDMRNIPCSISNNVCLHFKVTYFPCGNVFIPRNHGNVHFECKINEIGKCNVLHNAGK